MALNNKYFFIILLFIFSTLSHAELVELATKQSTENLRFVSNDGKYTYYQNVSGSLYLSTNYDVKPLIKSIPGTQFNVLVTDTKKKVLIEQNKLQNNYLSIMANKEIYVGNFTEDHVALVANGISPSLHLNDTWLSFYNASTKEINFLNIESSTEKFSIKLRNNTNPYFIPDVIMLSNDIIIYTDLNAQGFHGLIEFNRKKDTMTPLIKSSTPSEKIEICLGASQLYIGEFGLSNNKSGSSISSYSYRTESIEKRDILYESPLNDIGHIKCSKFNEIFFIKQVKENTFDAAKIIVSSKKLSVLTDSGAIFQLVEMDKKILTESMGKYFIIDGINNLGDDTWVDDNEKK